MFKIVGPWYYSFQALS